MLRIGVLVSGEGTTLDAIAERVAAGQLAVEIALVVSDRPGAPALGKAERRGLATLVLSPKGIPRDAWGERLTSELRSRSVELVVLAGFLPILPASWVADWSGRAINLHPSLLPRFGGLGFYGMRVHEAVLASGDRETGASVHVISTDHPSVDGGPVVAQQRLAVRPDDTPETLRQRLHPVEVDLLVQTLGRFADGSLPLPYRADPAAPR
jgi:phosphoribosylglycinamide formyltransferase 1